MTSYQVDTAALRGNLETLQKLAGDATFWAVLKGNGYGLGVRALAGVCLSCGVTHFAVTEIPEVQAIRALSEEASILMLRPTCDEGEIKTLLSLNSIFTVSSQADANILNEFAARQNEVAEAHIKIDTGMGRYGFLPSEIDKILTIYTQKDAIAVTGIYSHLYAAFGKPALSQAQYDAFSDVLHTVTSAGIETGTPHLLNSCGLLRFPEWKLQGVRVGSAILGRVSVRAKGLRRVGVCRTEIAEIRTLEKGMTTGYGAGWQAKKTTQVAILPVGYYHGFGVSYGDDLYRRRDSLRRMASAFKAFLFGKKLYVSIGGKKCRVLGHIGMLHTAVDISKLNCQIGDTATVEINPLMLKGMPVEYI